VKSFATKVWSGVRSLALQKFLVVDEQGVRRSYSEITTLSNAPS